MSEHVEGAREVELVVVGQSDEMQAVLVKSVSVRNLLDGHRVRWWGVSQFSGKLDVVWTGGSAVTSSVKLVVDPDHHPLGLGGHDTQYGITKLGEGPFKSSLLKCGFAVWARERFELGASTQIDRCFPEGKFL